MLVTTDLVDNECYIQTRRNTKIRKGIPSPIMQMEDSQGVTIGDQGRVKVEAAWELENRERVVGRETENCQEVQMVIEST